MRPFVDVEDEIELASLLHDGEGLDLDKLPPEVPQSVVDMIKVGALCIMIATKLIRFEIVKQTLSSSLFYASYLILSCIILYWLTCLKALLDANHNNRRTAEECFIILGASYAIYLRDEFDIFFSHPWEDKPFLKLIYR